MDTDIANKVLRVKIASKKICIGIASLSSLLANGSFSSAPKRIGYRNDLLERRVDIKQVTFALLE